MKYEWRFNDVKHMGKFFLFYIVFIYLHIVALINQPVVEVLAIVIKETFIKTAQASKLTEIKVKQFGFELHPASDISHLV